MRRMRSASLMTPSRTSDQMSVSERSRPVMPLGARSSVVFFSMAMCGAWSVTMMSMVPSLTALRMASRSSGVLRGGLTLASVL